MDNPTCDAAETGRSPAERVPDAYWALEASDLLRVLRSAPAGLSDADAADRLARLGPNEILEQDGPSSLRILWNQLRSPLLLLLVFGAAASAVAGEWPDALIVTIILLASVALGYTREHTAQRAAARLKARIRARASVVRSGATRSVAREDVVPGDVVLLSAGSLVPADAVVLEANDLFVSEAVLTGESFPVEKRPGRVPGGAALAERTNSVFLGTNVRSGTGRCIVVHTGRATQFGTIAHRLALRPPETEFDRGIRRFGYLLTVAMFVMVVLVFAVNVFVDRPPIETLLFSVALAIGLSPELLPAILSVNLARGASMMASHGVLVRRLPAIENLGSMDVLCTDKTGTLTEGAVRLDGAYGPAGERDMQVLELAALNAHLQAGLTNPLDDAILKAHAGIRAAVEKLGEVPYDFSRKRLSVVVRDARNVRLITKGAFEQVLAVCTHIAGGQQLDAAVRARLEQRHAGWAERGIRVLAVASRQVEASATFGRDEERELTFEGFVTFADRPKEGVREALAALHNLGVEVKLITGDSRLVARHVATEVGMRVERVLTGKELDALHGEALWRAADRTQLFAEVDPNQKERIVLALKKMRRVVGFLGDGVNDAPAMHAADTSLSVEQAVDVAREAADFVLLDRDLDVIRRGIDAGRKTFANTLKYVLTTTSANLGNMVSMAVASTFLPFLPLTAGQILLNNFLSDLPAVGLADDRVDSELVDRPRRWDMRFIARFMVTFGVLSSLFDFLTFAVLLGLLHARADAFRTAWFVESLLTELAVALVVRTRRAPWTSRPGGLLLGSTLAVALIAFAIPFMPRASALGFVPLSCETVALLAAITCLYLATAELAKRRFYHHYR